ncbi:MOSC domain-containing protein [Arenibacter sp. GZD96]|uniref:MOSC domain-containing protein n=1 Tax=Aurantibrevibacter litoralis TaxID=3106030 RepID=UPI002AFE91D3|nr:MOSC domain-containing protein [Arenibacter sp. GZD-96]MEA1787542.1 MOSC domain-containing protein [Arenibacter sp. GZD-96]
MKIIATNLGKSTTFLWNGKEETTGIFKYPTDKPLFLGKTDVANDTVIDRVHHAGENKACYLFSTAEYDYWKPMYPKLQWNWGMFGENLTIEGLDETQMRVGAIYRIGDALVQVSQPREPCYKLGIRFGDQKMISQFVKRSRPGTYVRVLTEGWVTPGDKMLLETPSQNPLTVQQFYTLLLQKEKEPMLVQLALDNPSVPQYKKERLKKFI